MVRRILFCATLAVAALSAVPAGLSAQQSVSTGGGSQRPGASLGFAWGWDGGITMGEDGAVQVSTYPTVKQIREGSAAARAGLRAGDRIISANGRDGRRPPLFEDVRPGSRVVLRIRRADEEREITFLAQPVPPR